ncbi:DMT family transporter [Roseovarius sp. LXJ103]|uniref:DMT family transporter n=1 Tax=Roseovarius carneus TaxID=2853164 RepID=UPI000D606A4C|nr:DMT family transporter [Roseovarius carneus]MBZ8117241.1 DMT family transporter [Roseovarius carneus]PWE36929.1 EamA family transporter [Pelagicola sp. LXJ1103]
MARSDNLTAAIFMMVSMAAFTINDTFMKMLAGDMPFNQLLFLRGLFTSIAVGGIAWWMGAFRFALGGRDARIIALRTLAELGATYCFLTALFNMPLANVTAILQALPLTLTLAAALFLRDPVGWRRMVAVLVGFAGVMLIVRPGPEGFNPYALYGLGAVCCVTLRDLATRGLSREVPSMLVTFVTAMVLMVVFGLASLGTPWEPLAARETGLIVAASGFVIVGYLFSVMVMRVGEISFSAPFRYTAILWALLLGWLAFGEWPDPLTLLGAGIVVGCGLFTLYREARLGRRIALSRRPPRR